MCIKWGPRHHPSCMISAHATMSRQNQQEQGTRPMEAARQHLEANVYDASGATKSVVNI